jgi:hypothetical protein
MKAVDAHGPDAAAGQLVEGRAANSAGAENNRVVVRHAESWKVKS